MPAHVKSGTARRAAPQIAVDLGRLVWPISPTTFLQRYWQKRVFQSHASALRVRAITREIGGTDIRNIAAQCGAVLAILGRHVLSSISIGQALVLLEHAEATLQMRFAGPLADSANRLGKQLKVVGRAVIPGVYVSNHGGVPPHWDQNDNFTIQLQGVKEWKVSDENVVAGALKEGYEELQGGFMPERPMPPTEWKHVQLVPGSVLYVPRGYWHSTTTIAPSISLNLLVKPNPWADVITEDLRRHLMRFPEWRKTAHYRSQEAEAYWKLLREELVSITFAQTRKKISPSLAKRLTDRVAFRRAFRAQWRVEGNKGDDVVITIGTSDGRRDAVQVPIRLLPLCRWVSGQSREFKLEDCLESVVGEARDSVKRLVELLVDSGFLEVVRTD
ncbi:MAG TPA: cupin domain-containing protein [Candidatus Polarisedimenticolaceae bacterium]|nr:cupin domain-containing protein [Candidatus Polarisedimenticolaceae bacterium]